MQGTSRAFVVADNLNVRSVTLDRAFKAAILDRVFESHIAPIRSRLIAAGVERLGLFGSFSRGEAGPDSDVDVLVRFRADARTYDNLYEVGEALEEVFHRRVDLVTEGGLSPYIGPKILREVKYVDLTK